MTIATDTGVPKLKHFGVTQGIIGAFYEVYNELGHGFLESVYREAMVVALRLKNLGVEREKAVNVEFRGEIVGLFRTDLTCGKLYRCGAEVCSDDRQQPRSSVTELLESNAI